MNTGYILLIVLGLTWTVIAVVMSEAKRRNCSVQLFYFAGSLFAAAVLLSFIGNSGIREIFSPGKRIALWSFIAGAVFNGTGQLLTMTNLKNGGRAVAYVIPQQAFIFPYVWSIFFFNQHFTLISAVGMLLIVGAIMFLTLHRKQDNSRTLPVRRIAVACIALLFMGVGQIFMVLPTQLAANAILSPVAGTSVIFCTNAVFFGLWCAISGMPQKFEIKKSFVYGLVWGAVAVLSFCVLLQALRLLGEDRQAGIVFPAGTGVLIVCYTAFTALFYREKLNFKQVLAFGVVSCGILMSKLG